MSTVVQGALATAILVLGVWSPATAHAEEANSSSTTPHELVEQALQTLQESPQDVDLVLELISEALEIEAKHPSGTVNNLRLQSAITALRRGNLEDAELWLETALTPDRHALQHDPLASAPPESLDPLPPSVGVSPPDDVDPGEAAPVSPQGAGSTSSLWPWALVVAVVVVGGVGLRRVVISGRRRDTA